MNPLQRTPSRSRRITGKATFYNWIVPILLVALAVMMIAMIGVAAAVLFNVIVWR